MARVGTAVWLALAALVLGCDDATETDVLETDAADTDTDADSDADSDADADADMDTDADTDTDTDTDTDPVRYDLALTGTGFTPLDKGVGRTVYYHLAQNTPVRAVVPGSEMSKVMQASGDIDMQWLDILVLGESYIIEWWIDGNSDGVCSGAIPADPSWSHPIGPITGDTTTVRNGNQNFDFTVCDLF